MCLNIFYLTFLISLVTQTIAVPISTTEPGNSAYDPKSDNYFNELCLKRPYSLTAKINAIKNLYKQFMNAPDAEIDEIKSKLDIKDTIEALFFETVQALNTTDGSVLNERFPQIMEHFGNEIVNVLLLSNKDQLKTTIRTIDIASKELTTVLSPYTDSIGQTVIQDLITTITVAGELINDPEFFFNVTEEMDDLVDEANRYTGVEDEQLKASFFRLTDQINKIAKSKNKVVIDAAYLIRERILHQVKHALSSPDVTHIPQFLECLAEEAILGILLSDFYHEFSSGTI